MSETPAAEATPATEAVEELAWHLRRALVEEARVFEHVLAALPGASRGACLVVETAARRVALLSVRSAMRPGSLGVHPWALYDLRGFDVLYRFPLDALGVLSADVLVLLAGFEPGLFSLRGRMNAERLCSREALLAAGRRTIVRCPEDVAVEVTLGAEGLDALPEWVGSAGDFGWLRRMAPVTLRVERFEPCPAPCLVSLRTLPGAPAEVQP